MCVYTYIYTYMCTYVYMYIHMYKIVYIINIFHEGTAKFLIREMFRLFLVFNFIAVFQ